MEAASVLRSLPTRWWYGQCIDSIEHRQHTKEREMIKGSRKRDDVEEMDDVEL